MRVSKKALASASALLLLSACVTPPPIDRGYGGPDRRYPEPARYDRPPAPQADYDRGYDRGGNYDAYRDEYNDAYLQGPGYYTPPPTGRLSLLLGGRSLSDDDFQPTDAPGIFGIEYSQVPDLGGLGFEFGVQFGFASEDGVQLSNNSVANIELQQAELYAGVRAELGKGAIRPYVGGGGTFLSTTTRVEQGFLATESDDSVLGAYLHAGLQADLTRNLFIGVDYRHIFAGDYEINGGEVSSEYDQIAAVLGFSF